ncbi:unnamed protein product [Didymodactylos carnosus]|uniref:Protein kinase domain-containing protein n=1 Tax=Didymodactylos carnosus TaxID=1234261 RepID=A0A813XHF9_9BILA|nr:unnamed protein product [Didymodactylos carnosus]CAF0909585.1 unnamed protein product [Didymodactylos carnosus]CAF3658896.1 unnamed protein product [Didymodactylos carnosus]CAF3688890.1 unnamed protein product [Didymodactylos carnosus]
MSTTVTNTGRLRDLHTSIRDKVGQVKANQRQCERLVNRIDQIIDSVERLEKASGSVVRPESHTLLSGLLSCIDNCNRLIEKFTTNTWYKKVYENQTDRVEFEQLNRQLSNYALDLSLGLNIQQLFDRNQDQEDLKEDLSDISRKLDTIAKQMLDEQQQQNKRMNQMIEQRFQSFRSHLTQSLEAQRRSDYARTIRIERERFLHIPLNDLLIENKLGSGGFADVHRGLWLTHHDTVAIKIIRMNHLDEKSPMREDFYREISTMYRIRYENVINVIGACVEPNFYAIILEYMGLGSLYDILHRRQQQDDRVIKFTWPDRWSIALQMAKGINYLHRLTPPIIHRDVKSMNFLFKQDGHDKFIVKVSDFGLAEIRRESWLQSTTSASLQIPSDIVGSISWKAPELFNRHGTHTKESDIYSLGIVFWELATGRKPYDDYADETVIPYNVTTKGERPDLTTTTIDNEFQLLITSAWAQDHHQRPTCLQLIERINKILSSKYEENNTDETGLPSSNENLTAENENSIPHNVAIDLHQSATSTTVSISDSSFGSTLSSTSTKTAIQVDEQELRNTFFDSANTTIRTQAQPEQERDEVEEMLTPPTIEDSTSQPAEKVETPMTQIEVKTSTKSDEPCLTADSSYIPLQRSLSKSESNLETANFETATTNGSFGLSLPKERVEKRRPLHQNMMWSSKNRQSRVPTSAVPFDHRRSVSTDPTSHQSVVPDKSVSNALEQVQQQLPSLTYTSIVVAPETIERQKVTSPFVPLISPPKQQQEQGRRSIIAHNENDRIASSKAPSSSSPAASVGTPCLFSVSTVLGGDGKGSRLDQLHYPFDIFVTNNSNDIYVADFCNSRILKLSGSKTSVISGSEGSDSTVNQLDSPVAMFADDEGKEIFISDFRNNRIQKFSLTGDMDIHVQTVIGQNGRGDHHDQFDRCYGLFVDHQQQWIYLSDYNNHRVTRWRNVKDSSHSEGVVVAGGQGRGSSSNQLNYPTDICVDESENNLFICDYFNHRVQRWSLNDRETGGVTVIGGHGEGFYLNQLSYPMSMTLDSSNRALYVADTGNNRIIKLSLRPSSNKAVPTVILGTSLGQGPGHLFLPRKVFIDKNHSNQLYIVDTGNHRLQKFTIPSRASTSDSGGK